MNLGRVAQGGRNFEGLSADPVSFTKIVIQESAHVILVPHR